MIRNILSHATRGGSEQISLQNAATEDTKYRTNDMPHSLEISQKRGRVDVDAFVHPENNVKHKTRKHSPIHWLLVTLAHHIGEYR